MTTTPVLIIGAGPTGMTAAIEFRRAGMDVRIVDKSNHLARWSQALVVQARTLEQFQRYGIAATAVERGRKLTGARSFSEGKEIVHFRFDQVPSRYPYLLFLPQSETEAILNAHMESLGVKTERGVEMTALKPIECGAIATLRHPDGSTEDVQADWLLGCDGAHSLVRELIGIPFEGHGVDLHFFLGDLEVEGPDKPTDELLLHLHHGDVIFTAALSDRLTRVIIAKHANANGNEGLPADQQLSIQDFQRALDDAGVKMHVLRSEWMTPFHVNDRQAEHYRKGCIFLAGDASHIHSPVAGQGMNTGIQDVANLCWKIAAVERGSAEPDSLLDSYEQERSEVGRALLDRTGRALQLVTSDNPVITTARDLMAPHLTAMESVQRAIAGFISETSIAYRSSPVISDGGGEGELRAGDRLQDLTLLNHGGDGDTLLGKWTSGRHLCVLSNAGDDTVHAVADFLHHADRKALRSEDLDEEGRRLLGTKPLLLIVRPDGYVGFRGSPSDSERWRAYAQQDAL